MAQVASSPSEVLPQLEAARKLVLGDALFYSKIVSVILPIVGRAAALEVRRWGAEFLAETFATPALADTQKEELCLDVIAFMQGILEFPVEDTVVIKSIIQAAASLYAVLFKTIVTRPDGFFASKAISSRSNAWQTMTAIKSNILGRLDVATASVQLGAIKFVQKIVQVQTAGLIADPRRPDKNETSITMVPRNHALLSIPVLEAEASGLLDRLLSIFQENSGDPILVDATLNCLPTLIRTRPTIANKIVSTVLNFNPLKVANSPMTPRLKVIAKSLERTTRALLRNVNKNNPTGVLAPKIDAYLVRLNQTRAAVFAETQSLKRPAPSELTERLETKRAKLAGGVDFPPMPAPPNSYAQLFTLTEDAAFMGFDVQILPEEMVQTITHLTLYHLDPDTLQQSITGVRERYAHLRKVQQPTPLPDVPMAGPTGVDDEDDYDPEYTPAENIIETPATATAQALHELVQPDIALGPFELSKPPALTQDEATYLAQQTVERVFAKVAALEGAPIASSQQKSGLNRLAASTNDRDAWVTMLTRLATRAPFGLEGLVKVEMRSDGNGSNIKSAGVDAYPDMDRPSLANGIRHRLFLYVLEDFRSRLNVAISWLNEEWYNDRLEADDLATPADGLPRDRPVYNAWALRLLDSLLPYLDARDSRLLIRFLSEIPAINPDILDRVKSLAKDPERINMCMMALQYLILMRPPVRETVIDTVESIWQEEDEFREANAATVKVLAKWRPAVLHRGIAVKAEGGTDEVGEEKVNGLSGPSMSPELRQIGAEAISNGDGKDERIPSTIAV